MNRERKKIVPGDIIGLLMCVVFVPIIVVNLILIVNSYRNPDELPGAFGVKPAVVLSGSMEPAIETGDLILLRDTDPLGERGCNLLPVLRKGRHPPDCGNHRRGGRAAEVCDAGGCQ